VDPTSQHESDDAEPRNETEIELVIIDRVTRAIVSRFPA